MFITHLVNLLRFCLWIWLLCFLVDTVHDVVLELHKDKQRPKKEINVNLKNSQFFDSWL